VVPVFLLARDFGLPESYDFVLDLAATFPGKPILATFTGEQSSIEACRSVLEPRGIPTFLEIEQPFEALDILVRCRRARDGA
jgi:acyl-CoA synthetase (NDP forming)